MLKKILIITLLVFIPLKLFAHQTEWIQQPNKALEIRTLSSVYKDNDTGKNKIILGIHFKLKEGWKLYSNDSQGFGLAPSVDFTGSKNYSGHNIIWPKAIDVSEKIQGVNIKYSIYKNEVILPVTISLAEENSPADLKMKLSYGICNEICIPVETLINVKIDNKFDKDSIEQIQKYLPNKILSETSSEAQKIDEALVSTFNEGHKEPKSDDNITFLSALLAAFIGGLILNVMPCVLPVLGIKIISIIKHHNALIKNIRIAFISTFLGILFSFLLFSILAIFINLTGNVFNWGFQFQNPYFLVFLIVVLTLFTGNMLGFYEIKFSEFGANFLNKKIDNYEKGKSIFIPNFLSGILAVLLATPCSAPFLGTAISFSISQDILSILVIFLTIGLGFAFPYLILIFKPDIVYLLPKSGAWMNKFKIALSLLLISTALWLIYVLSNIVGFKSSIFIFLCSGLMFLALKIKNTSIRVFMLLWVIISMFSAPISFKESTDITPKPLAEVAWKVFKEDMIAKHVDNGKIVIVDITADWCLTCKYNKIRVLHDEDIVDILRSENVVAMRADITKPDKEVMDFMNKHKRYAIPFNIVFGPSARSGILTNEVLNKEDLIKIINNAK